VGGWIHECPKCGCENISVGRLMTYDESKDKYLSVCFCGDQKEDRDNRRYAEQTISRILACFCFDCKQISLMTD
jgi:hypothetical protein